VRSYHGVVLVAICCVGGLYNLIYIHIIFVNITLAVRVFYGGFRAPNSTWKRAGARFCRKPTRQWNIVYCCRRETSRKSYDDSIVAGCKTIQFAFRQISSQIINTKTQCTFTVIILYASLSEYLSHFRRYVRFLDFSRFHDLYVWGYIFYMCVSTAVAAFAGGRL